MKKILIRKNGLVSQEEYESDFESQDHKYYYVHYSGPNKSGKFIVSTNNILFEESRIIKEFDDKDLAIRTAYLINNTIRLLAGYYDNSPDKDSRFPLTK